jgi:uncharacterized protein
MRRLTLDQARRYALAAQGFTGTRPAGRVDVRHFRKVVDTIGVVQLDSVNVFARTHYMPFFSRLGPYDADRLDGWLWGSGEMFEYWAHMAAVIPTPHHRLFRWRMKRSGVWDSFQDLVDREPEYLDRVLAQVEEQGPLRVGDLEEPGTRSGESMWNWNNGKIALEYLFVKGVITSAGRPNFARLYDLTERVVPKEHLEAETPHEDDAVEELLLMSARSLGVGTASDLADYYRIGMPPGRIKDWSKLVRDKLDGLADRGDLERVTVEGWDKTAYLHPEAPLPRETRGTALLSPFDNLIFFRDRVERLWDFHYRIEIYTPAPKRVYGYYVLPFLLDGHLVGRVDLKSDRSESALLVRGSYGEPGIDKVAVGRALRHELESVASWLGLDEVRVADRGDLAPYV